MVADPDSYGVTLKSIRDVPYVAPVKVSYQINLSKVAELSEVPLAEVRRLNPAFRRGVTDPDGSHLLLPVEQAQLFQEKLAALSDADARGGRHLALADNGANLIGIGSGVFSSWNNPWARR